MRWLSVILCLLVSIINHGQNLDSLENYAIDCAQNGELEKAAEIEIKVYNAYLDLNDTLGILNSTNVLGNIYSVVGDFKRSNEYFNQGLQFATSENYKLQKANILTNIAINWEIMPNPDYDSAQVYFKQGLSIYKEENNSELVYRQLNNIGSVYGKQNLLDSALVYYRNAWNVLKEMNNPFGMVTVYGNIATTHRDIGNLDSAIFYYRKAASVSTVDDEYDVINLGLAKTYLKMSSLDSAAYYYALHDQWLRNKYNEQVLKNTTALDEKYKTEKKDKEIAQLKQSEAESALLAAKQKLWILSLSGGILIILTVVFFYLRHRKAKQRSERAQLEHKALRAQMNPHFIFNALAGLQRLYVDGKTEEANNYMADFSQLVRKTLELTGHSLVSLNEEIETLKLYVGIEKLRLRDKLDIKFNVDEELDLIGIKVPPLIIQPIAENAIWHGIVPKDEPGTLTISIVQQDEKELICTVKDDGVGLNPDRISQHKSKGLELIRARLPKKDSVQLNSVPEGGTEVIITIPIEYGD